MASHDQGVDELPDEVSASIETALGSRIERCRVPSKGAVADTYVLELDGEPGQAVCKCGGANIWTGDVVEPEVVQFVRQNTAIHVPQVLATGPVPECPPLDRWALYEYVDGTVPDTLFERPALLEQAGAALGELHAAIEFDHIGGLVRENGDLRLTDPRASNLLAGRSGNLFTAGRGGEADFEPVLTHGDFHPGNLLVADGELRAVLDWGNAHVTDAGYALARAEARFIDLPLLAAPAFEPARRERLRDRFREGYRKQTPLPDEYERLTTRFRLLWVLQSAVNLGRVATSPRGRTQVRRQCRNWLQRRRDGDA